MKKLTSVFVVVLLVSVFLSGCTTISHSMKEPNAKVNLTKSDFALSDQVTSEATSVKVLGIDWYRLFVKRKGAISGSGASSVSLSSVPVIGGFLSDKTANYALYQIMNGNPGYDVVFYPQYEVKVRKPILGIGLLTKITTVKATARLGKLVK